jgi:hypothetical protein
MGKLNIKNGTPVGSTSLCETCSNAQIMRGFRESEMIVLCTYTFDQPIQVPFKVNQCTMYCDKNRPSWEMMEKLAIEVKASSTLKPAGFSLVTLPKTDSDEDEVPDTATINL